ncbi:MAG TPA: HEAT repeat domain-containing protein [Thermodesulfobacteriota bacterium]|nr:HEAT repeat domain-containing protein [Thermodesulfobacteriota bacterium]
MDKRKEVLIKDLQNGERDIRTLSAEALERIQIRQNLARLVKTIESGEMLEKINALYVVADLKGRKIIEIIVRGFKDPVEDVRAAAARALGSMDDNRVLSPLVDALTDTSPIVLRSAIEALSRYNDIRLVGPLMKMLNNEDSGVVEKALEVIGRIGDKRSEQAMLYFAIKGNKKMRALAISALGVMET